MTGFENISYGELIAPFEDVIREAEMMTAVTEGCFSTLRCTFAQGNEPDVVPTSVPDGMPVKLVPAKREREKPDAAKMKPLTRGQIADIHDGNVPRIKEMIYEGREYTDLEEAINPDTGEVAKRNIQKAIANSFGAVYACKKPKVTLLPKAAKSASDEVASGAKDIAEAMDDLQQALHKGFPHKQIKNLRQVDPEVGQKIQVTCPDHNLYWSPPGTADPGKVFEPVYADEASLGKQHEVLGLVDGVIGKAHYYAVKIKIPHDRVMKYAYLNYRVRFFEQRKGEGLDVEV